MLSHNPNFIEVTTSIGCPVNCFKYCPQEQLLKIYKGSRSFSMDDFKLALKTVKESTGICFSGFCEAFTNPNCIEMIEYANKKGHDITIYSTLVGLKEKDLPRLFEIPVDYFFLHLPDAYNYAKIPITDEYMRVFFSVIKHYRNIGFTSMNDEFLSCGRENIARNLFSKRKNYSIRCDKLEHSQFVLLPNGNLQLCCTDYTLSNKIGNLFTDDFTKIRDKVKTMHFESCHYCSYSRLKLLFTIGNFILRQYRRIYEPSS